MKTIASMEIKKRDEEPRSRIQICPHGVQCGPLDTYGLQNCEAAKSVYCHQCYPEESIDTMQARSLKAHA